MPDASLSSLRKFRRHAVDGLSLADKVAFLQDRHNYPEATRAVTSIETHMSWVFLTDTRAYKMKKPLRYRSLDYRSLAARRRNCVNEVELNRRLAPQVYLGVLPLTRDHKGAMEIGGAGTVVDWLVEMKRLPEEATLEQRLRNDRITESDFQLVADRLAAFFMRAPAARELSLATVIHRLQDEIRESAHRIAGSNFNPAPKQAASVESTLRHYLAAHGRLIERRVAAGRIVEGHGDLRPEHVYILRNGTEVLVTDCLEFDRRLRLLDPVEELAFLAMECECLGENRAWRWLFGAWFDMTQDDAPATLLHFHGSLRAFGRARSSIEHLERPHLPRPELWQQRAERYLQVAALHAEELNDSFRTEEFRQ